MTYNLVWFKRDLRWHDHEPLVQASKRLPIRCIYVVEPELWVQADTALQHFEFIKESLQVLDTHMRKLGGCIEIHTGEMTDVLNSIWLHAPFTGIYSHEETGNGFTYARDLKVAKWCQTHHIEWHEFAQFGVVRRLKNRSLWQSAWEKHMTSPIQGLGSPKFWSNPSTQKFVMNTPTHLRHNPPQRQQGGRINALKTLNSFLNARSIGYRGGISSPLTAPDACSRLSAYLAYGCISMREVVQQARSCTENLPVQANRHRLGLNGFSSRLYWHCHFIQKLESEPAIEWRNMHRGYDNLREQDFNQEYFEALKEARTGWPMVDACVTMLRETGWLNFRMRAMLVSVAAYPLWLHWWPVGEWLATQFLDYEPGIHWSQLQMQSGTTGINTTRVYNPIKQAQDHDPHGRFVKRWLPHLREIPQTWLFEPWKMPQTLQSQFGCQFSIDQPLVDIAIATREAKQRLYARRQQPSVKARKKEVLEKHTAPHTHHSRKRASHYSSHHEKQLGFDF